MPSEPRLPEQYVQDCFHSYLKSSLTQAKVEGLLNVELLSSAEGDLMITGPALVLYFAALRCSTSPPSVPLPRQQKYLRPPTDLSEENCPLSFVPFLRVWAATVPRIQSLIPDHQHDLARIICNLEPLSRRPNPSLPGIAAELRAVAIEISQRRTFQDRYASDLQAAIDAGGGNFCMTASFTPPPIYDSSSSVPTDRFTDQQVPPYPTYSTISPPDLPPRPLRSSESQSSFKMFSPSSPAIELIRETLYAALADVLEQYPSLRRLIHTDPPRAYFASVAFAILDVATGSLTPEGSVRGVLGQELKVKDCPQDLKPFMLELAAIGSNVRSSMEEDDREAIELVSRGKRPPETRMEQVRNVLERGIGYDIRPRTESTVSKRSEEARRSVRGKAVALANRINGLALWLTKLKAFRDRQKQVFAVLAAISA